MLFLLKTPGFYIVTIGAMFAAILAAIPPL